MKWLMEFGAANLACAGLPCSWPDDAEPDAGLELGEADLSAAPEQTSLDATPEPSALH